MTHFLKISDLRKTPNVLERLKEGDSFLILRHGEPCGRLVPFEQTTGKVDPPDQAAQQCA